MSFPFNPHQGLILVQGQLEGPSGRVWLQLALDTGATDTLISLPRLIAAGYDPAQATTRIQVTMGSGTVLAPRVIVRKLSALGQDRTSYPVLGHTLPPNAGIDGLVGLNFLRGQVLTIDFRNGQLTLT